MDARKITIISTRDQKQSVIMSMAETLADLKADMDEVGIDYSGLTFIERLTKVELKDDSSVLPHDVPYRGTTTNELVFLLTNTENKIKSGMLSRSAAYALIKGNNLQQECIRKFGKNFTQCSTAELEETIEDHQNRCKSEVTRMAEAAKQNPPVDLNVLVNTSYVDYGVRASFLKLVRLLCDNGTIDDMEADSVLENIGLTSDGNITCETPSNTCREDSHQSPYIKEGESPYSDDEIAELIKGI